MDKFETIVSATAVTGTVYRLFNSAPLRLFGYKTQVGNPEDPETRLKRHIEAYKTFKNNYKKI